MNAQIADTRPGEYYVSVVDGGRSALVLGPFTNDHAGAIAMVEQARIKAEGLDPRAVWYSFGTCRLPGNDSVPIRAGSLNKYFGLPC